MANANERIHALIKKAAQLEAREQLMSNRVKDTERKLAERRKYVLGAAVVAAIKAGVFQLESAKDLVDRFNQRKGDRALFGLAAVMEEGSKRG